MHLSLKSSLGRPKSKSHQVYVSKPQHSRFLQSIEVMFKNLISPIALHGANETGRRQFREEGETALQSPQHRGPRGSDFPGQMQVTLAQFWTAVGSCETGGGGRLEQGEGGWGGGGVPGLEGSQKAGRKRWRPAASRSAPKESAAGAGPQVLTLAELAHKGHRSRLRGPLGSGGRSFLIKHTRGASGGCVLCRARGGTHTICWDVVWLLWLTPWFHTSVCSHARRHALKAPEATEQAFGPRWLHTRGPFMLCSFQLVALF